MSRGFDVFAPPDWSWAQEDGTFGNCFDDPGKYRGIPEEDRFRMVYCTTRRAGAFGETIARFRRSPRLVEGSVRLEPAVACKIPNISLTWAGGETTGC